MSVEAQLAAVLARFNRMLARDGGELTLDAVAGNEATVFYRKGENACESCVLADDDLAAMLDEAMPAFDPPLRIRLVAPAG